MARYTTSVNGTALSTTTGLLTILTTATGAGSVVGLQEIMLGGEAGSSAVARVCINRFAAAATAGTDPTGAGTAQTQEKLNTASAAPGFTVNTVFASTQGTLGTNDVLILGFNAFGGVIRWLAAPGEEIIVGGQGAAQYLGIRSRSGTSTVSGHIVCEQM